jgi:hypothetical protein
MQKDPHPSPPPPLPTYTRTDTKTTPCTRDKLKTHTFAPTCTHSHTYAHIRSDDDEPHLVPQVRGSRRAVIARSPLHDPHHVCCGEQQDLCMSLRACRMHYVLAHAECILCSRLPMRTFSRANRQISVRS